MESHNKTDSKLSQVISFMADKRASRRDLCLRLQPKVPSRYHDALRENMDVVHHLFLKDHKTTTNEHEHTDDAISHVIIFLDTYLDIFNQTALLYSPPKQTPSNKHNSLVEVEKSMKKYRDMFRKKFRGVNLLGCDAINSTQQAATLQSVKELEKICSLKKIDGYDKDELLSSLNKRMELEGHWIKMINTFRKRTIVSSIQLDLYSSFQDSLQSEYPKLFQSDTDTAVVDCCAISTSSKTLQDCNYYEENEVISFTNELIATAIADFQQQTLFEEDGKAIAELVDEIEGLLKQEVKFILDKNLHNKNKYMEIEMTEMINEHIHGYEAHLASIFNNAVPNPLVLIEQRHNEVKSTIVNEFKDKNTVTMTEAVQLLLEKSIYEKFRENISVANAIAAEEMYTCEKKCKEDIFNCLENVAKHLSKLTDQFPKLIGELQSSLERWVKDTIANVTRGTVVSKENVVHLLARVTPSANEAGSSKEKITIKTEHIKLMVVQAANKFIEMTEASRQRNDSTGSRASSIRDQVKSQLEFEIKATFGDGEPTEPHVKELEGKMTGYVMSSVVRAIENLDKKLDMPETRGSPTKNKVVLKRVKQEPKDTIEAMNEAIDIYDHTLSMQDGNKLSKQELEEGELNLDEKPTCSLANLQLAPTVANFPIIFQFSATTMQMGVMPTPDSTLQVLLNEFGKPRTSLTVGVTKGGLLVYGPEIDDCISNKTIVSTFAVEQHFLHDRSGPWSSEVQLCRKKHIVTVEVLLAFLLRKMKKATEVQLGCLCSHAIITVPYWLASTQRIQLKDAAKIAGFAEVDLINDMAAATFAFVKASKSSRFHDQTRTLVLVLSECNDFVGCALYSVQRRPTSQIKMLFHNWQDLLVRSSSSEKDGSVERTTENVLKMCKDGWKHLHRNPNKTACFSAEPTEVIVICDQGDNRAFWQNVLENVRMEFTGNRLCSVPSEDKLVFTGAALLAQNLSVIGVSVKDKVGLPFWISRTVTTKEAEADKENRVTSESRLNVSDSESMLPPRGLKRSIECGLPPNETSATFSQSGIALSDAARYPFSNRIKKMSVGLIEIHESYPKRCSGVYKQLIPNLSINHEGIVSFDHVKVLVRKSVSKKQVPRPLRGKKRKRDADRESGAVGNREESGQCTTSIYRRLIENDPRILWKTPNLSENQIASFQKLILFLEENS